MITFNEKGERLLFELKKFSPETYYHCVRVKKLVYTMLQLINNQCERFTQQEIDAVCKGALLHDIGKLFICNSLLTKRTKFTANEKEIMGTHTTRGYDVLRDEVSEREAAIVLDICLRHHEHLLMQQCEEKQLPLYVQIVSVCDTYDALRSERVYRKSCAKEVAIRMIESGECGVFSAHVVDYLKKTVEATGD